MSYEYNIHINKMHSKYSSGNNSSSGSSSSSSNSSSSSSSSSGSCNNSSNSNNNISKDELIDNYSCRIGVVGSRYCTDYKMIKKELDEYNLLHNIDLVVTGGAKGVDALAEKWAKENNVPLKIYYPILSMGKKGYAYRNQQIVDLSTQIIAFPSKTGKGTQITIDMAKRKGLNPKITWLD